MKVKYWQPIGTGSDDFWIRKSLTTDDDFWIRKASTTECD